MKKKLWMMVWAMAICIFLLTAVGVSAETYDDSFKIEDGMISVTEVPDLAYEVVDGEVTITGCDLSATTVEIPEMIDGYLVTTIGDDAFKNCSITNIVIPNSIRSVGCMAFLGCEKLKNIEIPDSTTSIGSLAFLYCHNLEQITVSESNQEYSSLDGILFDKKKKHLIVYPAGKRDESYIVPTCVINIEEGAFAGCNDLKNVVIPDGVAIGGMAFEGCGSLTSIVLPKDITSIEGCCFLSCCDLTNIIIPNGVTRIGNSAFGFCSSLKEITIPESITEISEFAFIGCEALETVYYIGDEEKWRDISIERDNEALMSANIIFLDSNANVEIKAANSTDDSLKFISKIGCDDETEIKSFGMTFIPLWLFEDGSAEVVTVEYDNSKYGIKDGQTFGATLTDIPASCRDMAIVAKAYFVRANGDYVWSDAKTASVNDTKLANIQ